MIGDIKRVAKYLAMTEEQAKDVCALFDRLVQEKNSMVKNVTLKTDDDYIDFWESNWFRAMNWDELVQSEVEQGGWESPVETIPKRAEEFCKEELNITIFKLPCGMYVQYV